MKMIVLNLALLNSTSPSRPKFALLRFALLKPVLLLVAFFSLFPTQASWAEGTDCSQSLCRYVRAGATGTGQGTDWTNAYTSLPATLTRGTVYFIADGTYSGRTFSTATNKSTVITIKKATGTDHGTGDGWQAAYGDGQAAFTGGLEFTTSDWVLDGQTGGGAANNWAGTFGFKITETSDAQALIKIAYSGTADNITIRHVEMQGKGSVSSNGGSYSNDGVAVYGASNITISHFRMRGIGRGPFFLSAKNFIAEHGWVESFYGSAAVHSEIASIWAFDGSVGDTTFRYNLFTDVQSTGGLMWDNSSNTSAKLLVYGNVFYKPPGANWGRANGVIGGWTGGGGEQFHNAKVYNNTFINVDQASLSTNPNIFSGNEAYNNIFYNCSAPSFDKFASHDNNLFISSGGVQGEPNGVVATGNPFVDMAGFDFRLVSASGQSRNLASPFNLDPLGNPRGADGIFDRGAFEYGVIVPPAPTPTPTPAANKVEPPGSLRIRAIKP